MAETKQAIKCPSCEAELNTIGYTEHGTLELVNGEWLNSDSLECNYHFT